MKWMNGSTNVRHSFFIFSILLFLIALLTILYGLEIPYFSDPKWLAIISGLLTGFIVALFQTILSLSEIRELDKYRQLKIQEILPRRNNRDYYKNMISKAKNKIYIQGVTAQRFLHDFANKEDTEEGSTVLLSALGKGVEVRILVAAQDFLSNEEDKKKSGMADQKLKELTKYSNFKFAYYSHEPTHSIVTIDEQSIVGPIFSGTASEHTPAIHLKNSSEFVEKYLKYFKDEWKKYSQNNEELPN